jgi:hypothetical protein
MRIETINEKYFGDKKTHRYLLDVYRECVEKLITVNVLIEVWAGTKGAHEHTKGRNCSACTVFYQVCFSCIDSLFLHLRMLFSREEYGLADSFLNEVKELSVDDFKSYYKTKYEHEVSEAEQKTIEPLFALARDSLLKISSLYFKRVEPYQAFVFHQPEGGEYYNVTIKRQKGEGINYVTHVKKGKFKRDLQAAKEMLDLAAEVIHLYLKFSSKYYHTLDIYPRTYVKEIVALLGVEQVGKEAIDDIAINATIHSKQMVHVLECSGGLKSHNGLEVAKIKSAQRASCE